MFTGNGNGSFKAGKGYATGINPRSAISTDVNGDGKLDLVSADSASNQIGVFIGNGDGTFQNAITYATGLVVFSVISADVDGDGEQDDREQEGTQNPERCADQQCHQQDRKHRARQIAAHHSARRVVFHGFGSVCRSSWDEG